MQIDDKLLAKLEKLSSIKINDEKKEQIKAELGEIVNFVQVLDTLSLDGISPAKSGLKTPFRADVSAKSSVIKDVFAHSPSTDGEFFIVPKIIE